MILLALHLNYRIQKKENWNEISFPTNIFNFTLRLLFLCSAVKTTFFFCFFFMLCVLLPNKNDSGRISSGWGHSWVNFLSTSVNPRKNHKSPGESPYELVE